MANPNAREDGKKGGRPKGSPNKLPRDLKEKVLAICDHLEEQGKGLQEEAEKDPQWFYTQILKPMLPKDVKVEANIRHTLTDEQLGHRISQLLGKAGTIGVIGGSGEAKKKK